jgi:hypothetical protein
MTWLPNVGEPASARTSYLSSKGRFVVVHDSHYQFVADKQKAFRQAAAQARLAKRSQRRRWWKRSNSPQAR